MTWERFYKYWTLLKKKSWYRALNNYFGNFKCITFLIVILLSSCLKVNVDNSISRKAYKKAIKKEVNKFLTSYNDTLMSKVHKSFWSDFYFYKNYRFKTDIIVSSSQQTLIYIEQSDKSNYATNIFFTDKNPVLYIQELKNNVHITPASYKSFYYVPKGFYMTISRLTLEGTPIPVTIEEKSFVVLFDYCIRFEGPVQNQFVSTEFPGMSFLIGSNKKEDFNKLFIKAASDNFNSQLQKYYLESELFRKAFVHPFFKKITSEIKQRQSEALNHTIEYPPWEFERDINKMRAIARENSLSENYVDEIIKDPQYYPISGILLFYYSNEKAFMLQWCLINIILLAFIFVLSFSKLLEIVKIQSLLSAVILAINAWVFYKRPDLISIEYWITPCILGIASYILLYFQQIKKAIK